jgi:hypothetical protein
MPRKVVVISDSHSGHHFGYAQEKYWPRQSDDERYEKVRIWQEKTNEWLRVKARELGPIDKLICNGDMIEGDGYRSGGVELFTTDRLKQVEMASELISLFDYKSLTIVDGTDSHTGLSENYEETLAQNFGLHAQDHAWVTHAGVTIEFKHHIGSTQTPRGTPPALSRDAVWNLLWAEKKMQPKSDIIVRSHLHHLHFTGDSGFLGIVTPALQGWTRYGARRMSKTIDFGLLEITIFDNGDYSWKTHILNPLFAAAKAEQL